MWTESYQVERFGWFNIFVLVIWIARFRQCKFSYQHLEQRHAREINSGREEKSQSA